MYVGETGRSVRTRKREHADAVKTFNTKKSALSQHVMEFDHRIDWDNVKILKSESHAYRRRIAESFLINQKACSCNVINRNDGANFPTVYSDSRTNTPGQIPTGQLPPLPNTHRTNTPWTYTHHKMKCEEKP